MEEDVTDLFNTEEATAELSDLTKEENQFEQSEGELEVYAGTFDADGEPLVFEAYLTTEQMRSAAQTILVNLVPLILGTLALFMLAVLLLAMSLARGWNAPSWTLQDDAARLLASDLERGASPRTCTTASSRTWPDWPCCRRHNGSSTRAATSPRPDHAGSHGHAAAGRGAPAVAVDRPLPAGSAGPGAGDRGR